MSLDQPRATQPLVSLLTEILARFRHADRLVNIAQQILENSPHISYRSFEGMSLNNSQQDTLLELLTSLIAAVQQKDEPLVSEILSGLSFLAMSIADPEPKDDPIITSGSPVLQLLVDRSFEPRIIAFVSEWKTAYQEGKHIQPEARFTRVELLEFYGEVARLAFDKNLSKTQIIEMIREIRGLLPMYVRMRKSSVTMSEIFLNLLRCLELRTVQEQIAIPFRNRDSES
jgi:hypothetical protein